MQRARPLTVRRRPGDGRGQRVIQLEDARAVAIAAQRLAVALRQAFARDEQQLARRQVKEQGARPRQLVDMRHRLACADLAAQRAQQRAQRLRQSLRAAARRRPADALRQGNQHQGEGG